MRYSDPDRDGPTPGFEGIGNVYRIAGFEPL